MIKLVLSEVVDAMGGRVAGGTPTLSVRGVSTDSRTATEGELFFALDGPRFDGHAFVVHALKRKAVGGVVASDRAAAVAKSMAQAGVAGVLVEVNDPLEALRRLAVFHRRQLSADVIAVVGSNGKTTTKAMIDHILMGRLRGSCSPKSFNNAIGVPLTLLSAEASDDYLVVEIGTSTPGEVAELAALAQPKMAVITCISEEHLEGLGDLHGVAAEECSVLAQVSDGGFAAVNTDWPRVREYLPERGVTIATFGRSHEADLRISETRYDAPWLHFVLNGRFAYRLRMPGTHNTTNAAGAIAIARRWGLAHEEIAERLESFAALPMRTEILKIGGVSVVNDAYNANPESATAAIGALEAMPAAGRRVVVFGEMRELGARSAALHRKVAKRLRDSSVNRVLLVGAAGDLMSEALRGDTLLGPRVDCCETVEACLAKLVQVLRDGDVVLLKASRAVELDRLVEPLRSALRGQRTTPVT
ncbi:MAG: UDP-N-acetylmuramoyl-tripeptide--D-alanyl-D-alanine ligase [Phycisphaerae bacterium]